MLFSAILSTKILISDGQLKNKGFPLNSSIILKLKCVVNSDWNINIIYKNTATCLLTYCTSVYIHMHVDTSSISSQNT